MYRVTFSKNLIITAVVEMKQNHFDVEKNSVVNLVQIRKNGHVTKTFFTAVHNLLVPLIRLISLDRGLLVFSTLFIVSVYSYRLEIA